MKGSEYSITDIRVKSMHYTGIIAQSYTNYSENLSKYDSKP